MEVTVFINFSLVLPLFCYPSLAEVQPAFQLVSMLLGFRRYWWESQQVTAQDDCSWNRFG